MTTIASGSDAVHEAGERSVCRLSSSDAGPWWERFPERLDDELRLLDTDGVAWTRDELAAAAGILRLHVEVNVAEEKIALIANFPDNYPYFRFSVDAPGLDLPHHQHPFGKNLCLLSRDTDAWNPGSDRLATFLRERLPIVLRAGRATDASAVASDEEHVPEPFSEYYPFHSDTMVLLAAGVSGRDRVPADVTCGVVVFGVEEPLDRKLVPDLFRAALLEVCDDGGQVLVRAPEALGSRYPFRLVGRWARVSVPVRAPSEREAAEAVYRASANADARRADPTSYHTVSGWLMQVRALLYPEEHRWRGDPQPFGDGWVFSVRLRQSTPSREARKPAKVPKHLRGAPNAATLPTPIYYLTRPGRYAPGDLDARIPELSVMREHSVAVFGLGCLGSPSALEFARADIGSLQLLDPDVIDPATTPRWQVGLRAAGVLKATVLSQLISKDYPYVRVMAESHRVGQPRGLPQSGQPAGEAESTVLARMLDGASVLYDATAERGVQRFLAECAREREISYLGVEATAGGWGGVVVRIVPGETEGCWICLQHWRCEPPEAGGIPAPPHDPVHGDVHPEGCADRTYTGANFDLGEVALMGVRTALGTMSGGKPGSYPAVRWDVAVVALRGADGRLTVPEWRTFQLKRHPLCAECARRN